MIRLILLLSFLLSSPASGFAESRYKIENNTLIFDMTIAEQGYEFDGGVDDYDEPEVISYLFNNPEITTLRVTGPGGSVSASSAIAEYLALHNINTEAVGICNSSCALIFLGGETRTLYSEAKLGFHRAWLDPEAIKKEFVENRIKEGWDDEFDYAAMLYDQAQTSLLYYINFMLSRGVDIDFILNILSTESYNMWAPTREELLSAGVLTK